MAAADPPLSLYLHVPFCREKCPYCDFYSGRAERLQAAEADYFSALTGELELYVERERIDRRPLRSVYFGGGTPGMIPPERARPLSAAIQRHFTDWRAAEWTIEMNPGSTDQRHIGGYLELGFNRFSVGTQSFHDELLKTLGRAHAARETREFIAAAIAATGSPDALSLDLIFAVPGQTLEMWECDLNSALAYRPGHVSLYGLTYYPGTRFTELRDKGLLSEADEDLQAEMYRLAREKLAGAGYRQYELSNFARPGLESVHNQNYWMYGDYLGLGAAAHSFLNGRRFSNPPDARGYIDRLRRRELCAVYEEQLTLRQRLGERMMLGLRMLAGIELAQFAAATRVTPDDYYRPELERLRAAGLLEQDGGRLFLTDRGLLLADRVMAEFF